MRSVDSGGSRLSPSGKPAGRGVALGLAGVIASAVAGYALVVRPWMGRWGSNKREGHWPLPGDDLVPGPKLDWTHAVTVHAPAGKVWPWLVQMGQGRGGFYSYDWIENLMGLNIHSAHRILPEFQDLKTGDRVPLAPGVPGIPVAILDPFRALVLHADTRADDVGIEMKPEEYLNVNWGFYLTEIDARTTRLIERWRADWSPGWRNELYMRCFLEPGAFLMERKMLLGIKERAEADKAGPRAPLP